MTLRDLFTSRTGSCTRCLTILLSLPCGAYVSTVQRTSEPTGPGDGPTDVPDRETERTSDQFEGRSIDRRTFLSITAATGTALSLPGTAAGQEQIESGLLSNVAEFAINHTPDDYEAGLVVEFADTSAAETFDETFSYDDDRPRPAKTVIRTAPTPAGHGRLTTPEIQTLLDMDGIEAIDFSPGANLSGRSRRPPTETVCSRPSRRPGITSPSRRLSPVCNTSETNTPTD